ncbi:MAG: aminotransferase class V-fold PLP-dependent enzyme [Planctomycetales bacterium]|jgi:cysteine desulfurase/selenocysteine lyase
MPAHAGTFDVDAVRRDFPILNRPLEQGRHRTGMLPVFLDSAASAQKPACVIEKEREVEEQYFANAYRGVYYFGARIDEELEASRDRVRQLLNAESCNEIVFTSGTTMSINIVARAWGAKFLEPGDEVLITEMEHHANIVPWQMVCEERGAKLRWLPLTDDLQLDLSQLDEYLTSKTKLVAVTSMSNVLGTINPVHEIARKAHAVGTKILVDAAQSTPHGPIDVRTADGGEIDFLALSGHKLFGPTGIGVLYGREDLLREMNPFLGGGHMISRVFKDHSEWADPPAKFEAGTIPIVQAIAMGAAIDYVNGIGFDNIHNYEAALLRYAQEKLEAIPGLKIYGPACEAKGSICSFTIDGVSAEDLANLLDIKGVFVRHGHHCTMPLHDKLGITASVRASFAMYSTHEEVDRLIEAINFALERLA